MPNHARLDGVRAVCLLAIAAFLLLAAQARAADSVYWANYAGKISFAPVDGSGGGDLDVTGADPNQANGVAIDAAAGRIYWVTGDSEKVFYASLGGGGGGELNTAGASPGFRLGLAVDPAVGRVYWANGVADTISYANLNGSGGGDLPITGVAVEDPLSVTVDPTTGRIYWGEGAGSETVYYANLDGSAGGTLASAAAIGVEATGVAIDTAAGRLYWAEYEEDKINYANLNGIGGGQLNTTGATVDGPWGVAVDPAAGRVYWVNEKGAKVSYARVDGSGGADLATGAATIDTAAFPVLLDTPVADAAPRAKGGSKPGSTLSCTAGTWMPDLLESFLSRAPAATALQWLKDGHPVKGATHAKLKAKSVGSYACQSTATNQAGSASQASAPVTVFSLAGKARTNARKGTAALSVKVPGAGTLTVTGKQLVKQKVTRKARSTGTVKLLVKAKGKAKRTLAQKGEVKVKATIAFAPKGGRSVSQTKTIVLKRALN